MAALLQSFLNRVTELEDATWDVLERYTIDGADDARLEVLGRIVGQPRFNFDTETYRAVIRGKIRANRSRGLFEDLIEVIRIVSATLMTVGIHTYVPATLLVVPQAEVSAAVQAALVFLLPRTRPAGVGMHVAFAPESAAGEYIFDSIGVTFDDYAHPGSYGPGFFDVRKL